MAVRIYGKDSRQYRHLLGYYVALILGWSCGTLVMRYALLLVRELEACWGRL